MKNKSVGEMTREKIVRFSGAVLDFNPIHYDDEFARKAGLPGVIAQGPLTFLMALDSLMANETSSQSGSFRARFKAPVLPGQKLELSMDENGAVSMTADGTEVLSGTWEKE